MLDWEIMMVLALPIVFGLATRALGRLRPEGLSHHEIGAGLIAAVLSWLLLTGLEVPVRSAVSTLAVVGALAALLPWAAMGAFSGRIRGYDLWRALDRAATSTDIADTVHAVTRAESGQAPGSDRASVGHPADGRSSVSWDR